MRIVECENVVFPNALFMYCFAIFAGSYFISV